MKDFLGKEGSMKHMFICYYVSVVIGPKVVEQEELGWTTPAPFPPKGSSWTIQTQSNYMLRQK